MCFNVLNLFGTVLLCWIHSHSLSVYYVAITQMQALQLQTSLSSRVRVQWLAAERCSPQYNFAGWCVCRGAKICI